MRCQSHRFLHEDRKLPMSDMSDSSFIDNLTNHHFTLSSFCRDVGE